MQWKETLQIPNHVAQKRNLGKGEGQRDGSLRMIAVVKSYDCDSFAGLAWWMEGTDS